MREKTGKVRWKEKNRKRSKITQNNWNHRFEEKKKSTTKIIIGAQRGVWNNIKIWNTLGKNNSESRNISIAINCGNENITRLFTLLVLGNLLTS